MKKKSDDNFLISLYLMQFISVLQQTSRGLAVTSVQIIFERENSLNHYSNIVTIRKYYFIRKIKTPFQGLYYLKLSHTSYFCGANLFMCALPIQ